MCVYHLQVDLTMDMDIIRIWTTTKFAHWGGGGGSSSSIIYKYLRTYQILFRLRVRGSERVCTVVVIVVVVIWSSGASELKLRVHDLNEVNLPLYCYRISVPLFVRLFCTRSKAKHAYVCTMLWRRTIDNTWVFHCSRIKHIEKSHNTSFLNLKGKLLSKIHTSPYIILNIVRMKGDVIHSHNKERVCELPSII